MKKSSLILCVVWVLIAGCAQKARVSEGPKATEIAFGDQVSIALTANRMLELEPCGCSVNPVGGLEREYNLFRNASEKALLFTGGTSFLPVPRNFSWKSKDLYLRKGKWLVEGLNQMKTRGLSVSVDDFLWGEEVIRDYAKMAKFPFFTTNIVDKSGKPVFQRYLEFQDGAHHVVVLSLSHEKGGGYPPHENVKVVPPLEAMASVMKEVPTKSTLVVLSSLPEKEQDALLVAYPQIKLLLRSHLLAPAQFWAGPNKKTLILNPASQGRSSVTVNLRLKEGDWVATDYADHPLSVLFEKPENPLTEHLKAYKKSLRDIAMEEAEKK